VELFIFQRFMLRASLAFACFVGLCSGVAHCVAAEPQIDQVRLGWNGDFKRGHWAEVNARITAADEHLSGTLEVITRDGDGAAVAFVSPHPVELGGGQSGVFSTPVKMGPPSSGLQLRIRHEGRTLARFALSDADISGEWTARENAWSSAHRSTSLIIAAVGPSPGIESSVELLSRSVGDEVAVVSLENANQLPDSLSGYDAIDCLVVTVADENPLAGASADKQSALMQWLRMGGRLILIAGDAAQELAMPSSPWRELFGGQLAGRSPLKSDAGLRNFTGEGLALSPPPSVWQMEAPPSGVALSESGSGSADRPLVVQHPVGLGRVSLVLFDLTKPPFNQWAGRGRLLARLISDEELAREPDAARHGGRMTHLGYRDLAGQLRMALDQYAGVTPVHFHLVAGALLVYLVLLGPGEYYLLRKAAPRAMHLTWLLFPLLLIGFVGGAIAWGRSARGSAVKINQLEVVDLDLVGGRQRGAFWTGFFAPDAQSVSLTAMPSPPLPGARLAGVQLACEGLPGDGLGGIDATPLSGGSSEPYVVELGGKDSPAAVRGLPLALASSKIFAGAWQGTIPVLGDASSLRRGKLLEIEGSFRAVAPVPLKNAFLAHGDWMYRAHNEVRPGEVINVANLERKHLEYFFTRRSVLKDKEVSAPWNQEETDIPRIMDIMMFHRGLQGRRYTVLSHRYHGSLDLTHLLHQGYAVLVGRSETPLVESTLGGKALEEANVRRWTYYRILYPVAPQ
jgi:hypothetical protein